MNPSNTKLKNLIGNRSDNMVQAQLDPMHRNVESPRSSSFVPSIEQFHRVQTWSRSQSARSHDDHDHSRKSTVLSRVKEKARRWRKSFLRKKNSQGDISTTPSLSVRLEDDHVDDDDEDENYQDDDPEYLGAPMYESELAPEGLKEHARQNPRAVPVISEKHVLTSSVKSVCGQSVVETKDQATASETEKHATHETHKMTINKNDDGGDQETEKHALRSTSDDHGPPLSPGENKWDKGVSVKEYIKNKLEPGEDEKVLSQVISDAMVPTRNNSGDHHHNVGVMGKMKVAVNSLLGREEPNQTTMKQSDNHTNTKPSSNIPVSTNPQAVMEEENQARILQTN